jgi:hypothetical protein
MQKFFRSYIPIATNQKTSGDKIPIHVIVDSTDIENASKLGISAFCNHNGKASKQIRLIYVVDARTKAPIFFRYIAGNIIDNSTLINTINMLVAQGIDIELVLVDAGYYSDNNLSELTESNIAFITRMPESRSEFSKLVKNYADKIIDAENYVEYGDRCLYGLKVPSEIYKGRKFAYVMIDARAKFDQDCRVLRDYKVKNVPSSITNEKLRTNGLFVLLSTNEYSLEEILPKYYTRQEVEQVFDISKTYTDIEPLRGHVEATIRGILLTSFLATAVYSAISSKLSGSKYSAHAALIKMLGLNIKIYENGRFLEELTADQRKICSFLGFVCPFEEECGNMLKKNSLIANIKSQHRKRGRPKGSKNKLTQELYSGNGEINQQSSTDAQNPESVRHKGRPKGSKNKEKTVSPADSTASTQQVSTVPPNPEGKRSRGRPKGSKNKVKTVPLADSPATAQLPVTDTPIPGGSRPRGRPKGSKNKVKTVQLADSAATAQLSTTDTSVPVGSRPRGRPKGSRNKVKTVPVAEPTVTS